MKIKVNNDFFFSYFARKDTLSKFEIIIDFFLYLTESVMNHSLNRITLTYHSTGPILK